MRTMFVKLFFWFWLSTLLAGGICFLLAINLRLSPMHAGRMHHFDEERRQFAGQALTLYGQNAAALREKGAGFESATESRSGMKGYLFAADGAPLSKGVPSHLSDALKQILSAPEQEKDPGKWGDVVVVKISGPSGTSYLAATDSVLPFPPRQPLHGFPFPPDFWLNFSITFLISGLVCYALAWRLTTPIRRLRAATQSFAGGDLTARVKVSGAHDGDELSDLGRDFNRMAGRIEKLVNSHRQLLRDVSHELRSPLARLGVALGLARKVTPPAAETSLDRIEQEAERLNLMIGELLTLSLLEGGSGTVTFEDLDLAELVEEVVRDASFEAAGSGRSVTSDCAAQVKLRGNREMLRRALENVVRNAIRYTKEGSAVEVTLARDESERAVIRVRDHGPGVPEAQLADIFRPFYRVAQARDRQSGGNGIGLAISEGTVALHGGSIAASNVESGGLLVEILLPA